jgi:nucleoside-diphosphate kinase
MGIERTFVMVKPDGVQRGAIGNIISRFEARGLKLVAARFMRITPDLAKKHYAEHVGKPFYADLEGFVTSGPVLAMVWEGDQAIEMVRTMMGKTDPKASAPGTIRGDLGISKGKNIIHGSDGPESAKREISLFFKKDELVGYDRIDGPWID